jgi:hypothetical protein
MDYKFKKGQRVVSRQTGRQGVVQYIRLDTSRPSTMPIDAVSVKFDGREHDHRYEGTIVSPDILDIIMDAPEPVQAQQGA